MPLYATGTDFLARYDQRLAADLVRDDGTKEPSVTLPTCANLLAALDDASSEIDAACFVGDRYTPAQLTTLSDTSANWLRRLCCDIALVDLKRRRGKFNDQSDGKLQDRNEARLKSIRTGEVLLMQATDSEPQASTLELDAPQFIPVLRRQTIRNRVGNRYYPDRAPPARSWPQ